MATVNELLKATARSFYLTLRVLPAGVSEQIGLAYLLARTTDTIADTELVPPARRLEALRRLRERILGQSAAPLEFQDLADKQGAPAEKLALEKAEESLAALQQLSTADRRLVAEVLDIITAGQELDLCRFSAGPGASRPGAPGRIIALQTAAELDDYTYRVAGCVGEFWTRLCRAHLYPRAKLDDAQMLADGVRFGKGLQLVNILRDLPCDLKNGRCYLPLEELRPAGLTPENLLSPENEPVFLPLYRRHLDDAEAHLQAGWRYTNALPFGQFRVRLACAWPALLGLKTVKKLRAAGAAALTGRVKVPRHEVYRMMILSLLAYPVPQLWRRLGNAQKLLHRPVICNKKERE